MSRKHYIHPAHLCTVTDEDLNPCIRPRVHTGGHHFRKPVRRTPRVPAQRVGR